MSTAGKVLVVLVMLTSLVWMVLSAGVAQLNTNGNKRLHDLSRTSRKLQADVEQAQRRHLATTQIRLPRSRRARPGGHRPPSRQSDVEKARSQISEILSRVAISSSRQSRKRSIKAKTALQHRNEEQQATRRLWPGRDRKSGTDSKNGELTNQLRRSARSLSRPYQSNVECWQHDSVSELTGYTMRGSVSLLADQRRPLRPELAPRFPTPRTKPTQPCQATGFPRIGSTRVGRQRARPANRDWWGRRQSQLGDGPRFATRRATGAGLAALGLAERSRGRPRSGRDS